MRESQRPSEKPRQTRQTGRTRQASAQSRRTASKRYEERAKRSKRHGQRHEQHGRHGKRHERRRAPPKYQPHARQRALVEPPAPPIELTPLVACSANTADVLWHIAECTPAIAQVAGRQSFGDACNAGISCAGRQARCSRSAADSEIVGNERFRKRSALHRKHGIVDLLAIGSEPSNSGCSATTCEIASLIRRLSSCARSTDSTADPQWTALRARQRRPPLRKRRR